VEFAADVGEVGRKPLPRAPLEVLYHHGLRGQEPLGTTAQHSSAPKRCNKRTAGM
jgi:hypothetical protein